MKYNILIPDLLTETRLEQKILGKKNNIILSNPKEFEMAEKPVCQECYVQNSKKAIAT